MQALKTVVDWLENRTTPLPETRTAVSLSIGHRSGYGTGGIRHDRFYPVAAFGVVRISAIDDARHALPLADVHAEGGLRVIEVTFRTGAAVDTLCKIARHRPDMPVRRGTGFERGRG